MVETCGRVVVTQETGSALDAGQNPPLNFFLDDPWPESPFVMGATDGCCGEEIVVLDEADEEIEDDEAVLCTLFRGGMNILETSSPPIEFRPPAALVLVFQPSLDKG